MTEQTPPVHRWADEHLGTLPRRDLCSYRSQSSRAVCSQEERWGWHQHPQPLPSLGHDARIRPWAETPPQALAAATSSAEGRDVHLERQQAEDVRRALGEKEGRTKGR